MLFNILSYFFLFFSVLMAKTTSLVIVVLKGQKRVAQRHSWRLQYLVLRLKITQISAITIFYKIAQRPRRKGNKKMCRSLNLWRKKKKEEKKKRKYYGKSF